MFFATHKLASCGAPDADALNSYYILNLSHHRRGQRYLLFFRPLNAGYAYPLSWAGKYTLSEVLHNPAYYHGGANIAVPCAVVDRLAQEPKLGDIDGNKGPVVWNTPDAWEAIFAGLDFKPLDLQVPALDVSDAKSRAFARRVAKTLDNVREVESRQTGLVPLNMGAVYRFEFNTQALEKANQLERSADNKVDFSGGVVSTDLFTFAQRWGESLHVGVPSLIRPVFVLAGRHQEVFRGDLELNLNHRVLARLSDAALEHEQILGHSSMLAAGGVWSGPLWELLSRMGRWHELTRAQPSQYLAANPLMLGVIEVHEEHECVNC